jgi:hypothetical protein
MTGAMRHFALLSCLAAFLIGASTASAATTAMLTHGEYTQLAAAQNALKSASSADATVLVCKHTKNVSPLLKAWKKDCNGVANYALTGIKAQAAAKTCTKYSVTADRMICMFPSYKAFYRAAVAYARADSAVDRIARARGFSAACVAVLGDPPKVVAAEARLASDLKQLVNALHRKDAAALQTAATLADKDQGAIESNAPSLLSLCPHR